MLPLSSLDLESTSGPYLYPLSMCALPRPLEFYVPGVDLSPSPSNPPQLASSILVKDTMLTSLAGSPSPNPRSLWRPSTLDLFIGLQLSSNNHINHIFLPLWEIGDTNELQIVSKSPCDDMKQTWNACWKSPSFATKSKWLPAHGTRLRSKSSISSGPPLWQ